MENVSILDTTLATAFVPGSNLKGDVAGANWSFLLPALDLEQILCLGAPPASTLATLARIGREVTVVCRDTAQVQQVGEASRQHGLTVVRAVVVDSRVALPLPDGSADLVVLARAPGASAFRNLGDFGSLRRPVAELERLLRPDGLIYFEFRGSPDLRLHSPTVKHLVESFGPPRIFRLMPPSGEMQTAVPYRDHQTFNYFLRHGPHRPPASLRPFKRAEQILERRLIASKYGQRFGVLLGRGAADPEYPPQYLRTIAEQAGVDLRDHRWGLSAPRDYRSRKVIFLMMDPATGTPEYIVKMTRDPAMNPRLENEHRALVLLREKGIEDRETLPQVSFFGHHNGLAILGETAIEGRPFRQETDATASCPHFRAATDWLIHLSATTKSPMDGAAEQVAARLMVLLGRFEEIYRLTPGQHAFLADQIGKISRSSTAFPLVFQHGDPGTWNLVVTPNGRVAFLDWEAAEPEGIPLWDLFYFLRSYSVGAARARGTRDRLKGFAQQFLAESPLSLRVVEATRRYCQQIGLSGHLVEPLFYTCWMHRALKEANRRGEARLENSHYVSLLRLCIEQRSAPTLRRLFSL